VAPAHVGGEEVFLDPLPALIIQDEMHLLDESLGSFGGLFETSLFAWLRSIAMIPGMRSCRYPGAPGQAPASPRHRSNCHCLRRAAPCPRTLPAQRRAVSSSRPRAARELLRPVRSMGGGPGRRGG
jgi:hypothetical protein